MWRGFRRSAVSETDKVRAGSGPLDNLVVLVTSLVVLVIVGAALLWYFGYIPRAHSVAPEQGQVTSPPSAAPGAAPSAQPAAPPAP
jgi:hypothetical protein